MELKDFVNKAIVDVVQGVEDARKTLGTSSSIGTTFHTKIAGLPSQVLQDGNGHIYSVISFDIAVTTSDESKGGGGINVMAFSAKGEVSGKSETVSRVSFSTIAKLS
ncbi:hypothetical protein A6R70_14495 [Agrobacterium rubi]|uniref:hypothetical protein n=1 Tax=Agrobacterium rubi TaxID=28099 RepID=UPI00201B6444|nr:hypothetical protein [Agrobacterium rubi]MCL6653499.1 hypothetical protein [Agrobacterium rubi]